MSAPIDESARGSALLERMRAGDGDALEQLLRRNEERLQRAASLRLGPGLRERVRSSDVLQSTYLRVLQSAERFPGTTERDFANWVVRILENTIKDRARYFRYAKRDRGREVPDGEASLSLASKDRSPSSEVILGEELAYIARAMERLPEDYARVLSLHLTGNVSHRETARELRRSETASRVLLARARARLVVELARVKRELDT